MLIMPTKTAKSKADGDSLFSWGGGSWWLGGEEARRCKAARRAAQGISWHGLVGMARAQGQPGKSPPQPSSLHGELALSDGHPKHAAYGKNSPPDATAARLPQAGGAGGGARRNGCSLIGVRKKKNK